MPAVAELGQRAPRRSPPGMPSTMPPAPRDQLGAGRQPGGDRSRPRCGRGPTRPRRTPARARARSPGSASKPSTSLGWWIVCRQAAIERARRLGLPRLLVDDAARSLTGEDGEGVDARRRAARLGERRERRVAGARRSRTRACPGCRGRPGRRPAGRPPPTLRTTSCTARPIVRLARLPWPSALPAPFIPMLARAGPAADDHRPDRHRRRQHAVDVELVVADRFDRGEHPRQVLGQAAGHHGGDGDLLDGDVDEVGRHGGDDVLGVAASCPRASAARAPRSAARPAGRRSSRGRTSPPSRPRARPARCAGRAARPPSNRTRSSSTRSGSTLSEPQPGRIAGRSAPELGDAGDPLPLGRAASRRCARPRRRRRRAAASAPSRCRGAS